MCSAKRNESVDPGLKLLKPDSCLVWSRKNRRAGKNSKTWQAAGRRTNVVYGDTCYLLGDSNRETAERMEVMVDGERMKHKV